MTDILEDEDIDPLEEETDSLLEEEKEPPISAGIPTISSDRAIARANLRTTLLDEDEPLEYKLEAYKDYLGLSTNKKKEEIPIEEPVPKEKKNKLFYEANALGILKNATTYADGVGKLQEVYDAYEWEEPVEDIIVDYGSKLRERFTIDKLSPAQMVELSPVKWDEIESDEINPYNKKLEEIAEWKRLNKEALTNSKDPRILANKELFERSIDSAADFAEGAARGEERDRDFFNIGWAKDISLRAARGAVNPLYGLVTGERFTSLDKYIDPYRNESLVSQGSEALGTVGAYSLGIVAAPFVSAPGVALTVGALPAAAGAIRERFNFAQDLSGDEDIALESAGIEAAAQAVGLLPFGYLGGKAIPGIKSLLGAVGEEVVEQRLGSLGGNILRESTKGAAIGAGTEGVQQIISNKSLDTAFTAQELDLLEGIGTASLLGGVFGGGLGALGGIGRTNKEALEYINKKVADTVLEVQEKVSKASEESVRMYVDGEVKSSLKSIPDETAPPQKVSIEDNIFGAKEQGVTILNENGTTSVGKNTTAHTLPTSVQNIEFTPIKERTDKIPDTEGTNVEVGTLKNKSTLYNDGKPVVEPIDNIFISNAKTYDEAGLNSGGIKIMVSMLETLTSKRFPQLVKAVTNYVGTLGSFNLMSKGDPIIKVARNYFSNPASVIKTLSHEVGHYIDFLNNYLNDFDAAQYPDLLQFKPLINRLKMMKDVTFNLLGTPETAVIEQQAKNISRRWRSGWSEEQYNAYRESNAEVFADVFSALMLKPDLVKEYPELYQAIDKGMSDNIDLQKDWEWWKSIANNPRVLEDIRTAQVLSNREAANIISQKKADADFKQRNPKVWEQGKNILRSVSQNLFDKYIVFKEALTSKDPIKRSEAFEKLNILKSQPYVTSYLTKIIQQPLEAAFEYVKDAINAGVDIKDSKGNIVPLTMKEFMVDASLYFQDIDTLKTTSPAIERIKADPLPYVEFITKYFLTENAKTSISKYLSNDYKNLLLETISSSNVEGMIDLLARFDFELRSKPSDLKYLPAYIREEIELINGDKALDENTKKYQIQEVIDSYYKTLEESPSTPNRDAAFRILNKISDVDPEVFSDITDPQNFKIPRYTAQEGLLNTFSANENIKNLQDKYGDNFSLLEKFHTDFHSIIDSIIPLLAKSGKYSPELLKKIDLNKGSYYHKQNLEYFLGYGEIDPVIRAGSGSLGERVDPISATISKMYVLAEDAFVQEYRNAFLELALLNGYPVTKLRFTGKQLFTELGVLKKKNPNDFYMIGYHEGQGRIYTIPNASYLYDTYENPKMPGLVTSIGKLIRDLSDLMMVRQIRTVMNPAFVIGQKVVDRFNEITKYTAKTGNPAAAIKYVYESNYGKKGAINLMKQLDTPSKTTDRILNEAIDFNLFDNVLSEYTGKNSKDVRNTMYDSIALNYGFEVSDKRTSVEMAHAKGAEILNKNILGRGIYKFAKYFEGMAERDEARTKFNGYRMGLELGMTKYEAANWARTSFGVPDPTGGGALAPVLNNYFLFARAYLNGITDAYNTFTKNGVKGYGAAAMGLILPSLFVTQAGGAVIGSLFGKDYEEAYQAWLRKVPSFDKTSKIMFPLGFIDGDGNFKVFGSFKAKDIGVDWKAASIGLPKPFILTDISRVLQPFTDGLLDLMVGSTDTIQGSFGKSKEGIGGLGVSFVGRLNPVLQWGMNTSLFAIGESPYDFYRNKSVFPKDVQEGGTFFDRGKIFAQYMTNQISPNLIAFNPYMTSMSPESFYDEIIEIPAGGPLVRSFFRVSNYGEYEAAGEALKEKRGELSALRISLDDASREMYTKYGRVVASRNAYGAEGYKKIRNSEEVREVKEVLKWHRQFQEFRSNIENAIERKDKEAEQYWRKGLEKYSLRFFSEETP